jgi:uncharacterized lipoprotein YmbA
VTRVAHCVQVSAAVALLVLTIAGCAAPSRAPRIAYYTLAVPGEPPRALPDGVEMGAFTASDVYATPRLAYRTSPFRIQYYVFHRWAAGSPEEEVPAAILDYLGPEVGAPGDSAIEIEGHIRRIEEVDDGAERRGVVSLELTARRGDRKLLERSYEESAPAGEGTPEAVVAAMSRALGSILDRFVADLASTVTAQD